MMHALRSAVSAFMLGFVCLLAAAIALVVASALIVALSAGGAWSVLAGVAVVGLLSAVGVAWFTGRRRRRRRVGAGVSITTEQQPLFWVEVYRVAEGLSITPPDELMLFADAEVAVSQNRTWMGLRPGVRRLHLGLPLLAGLTERQLRAVIAHEFCLRWGPSSQARVIYRGREIIGRVADRVGGDSMVGRVVGWYGRMYLAVSSPVIRRHELEADRLSADLAGNKATSASLRDFAVLSKGWAAFMDGYAAAAAAVGRRPQDLFAGFTCFLNEPGRLEQLAESAREPGLQRSAYDSQLSLQDRLTAIASLPEDDLHDKSGPALGMMRNPDAVIRGVEEAMFQESGFAPAAWEDIVPEAGGVAAREDALQLQRLGQMGGLGSTLSVATVLELLRHGLAVEMVRPLLTPGTSPVVERQLAGRLVTGFLATAAIESGTASYRFSWATPRQLVDDQGAVDDLPILVEAALLDGTAVPALELWLKAHHIGQELEVGADRGQVWVGLHRAPEGSDQSQVQSPVDRGAGPDDSGANSGNQDPGTLLVPGSWTAAI